MSSYYLDLIVQGSLYALVLFSIVTWVLILAKGVQHYRVGKRDKQFTRQFWSASTLDAASALASDASPKSRLANVGFEVLNVSESGAGNDLEHSWDRQELLERHLRQQIQKEYQSLESGLAVLASIGSTAPFVGLFGTVFGIIHALSAIGKSGSASIDVVAGPIGEALIATGVGIAVAVPAVLAFNFYVRRLKVTAAELDNYATDFVNLAQKNGFRVVRPVTKGATQNVRPVTTPQQGAFA
ncbi:outer membrane transport energization protein ExbB (TC 2.C.1.1.1) [Duganella sp. CF402]|uniref:MotA/TolQ/ExbB proton channel family protein n=1 Tax=unclassified Duganella TaxID=2636909 RepID=UPI0008CC5A73|nr:MULTISPECIES: MotA/TolQ/ExbB proton channel family protein [unclassified Duganella]RZT04475.1 outer membrane transport energization protein ExbB [Duganella sp. BK701]SEM35141.1 outer membrane transport energization protein ExbB (TC 2.C.1.1.1) [Duganella sp. CF402]